MRPVIWLRSAAVLSVLYAAGHTSGWPWMPGSGSADQALVTGMQQLHFDIMGSVRSYWDFYQGFGVSLSILMLIQGVLLWQCASLARSDVRRAQPMLRSLLIQFVLLTLVSLKYLFVLPVIFGIAIAVCIALALWPRRDAAAT